jgi:hypothetical protein
MYDADPTGFPIHPDTFKDEVMTRVWEYDSEGIYKILVRGNLDTRWSRWFADLQIIPQPDGNTLITGPIADQAALYGVISRMRDLGMVLISVERIPSFRSNDYEEID